MYTKYEQTAHYIQQFITEGTPEFAIILGSGLSSLQAEVTPIVEIPYAGIPNFPQLLWRDMVISLYMEPYRVSMSY